MSSHAQSNWKGTVELISAVVGAIAGLLALLPIKELNPFFDLFKKNVPVYAALFVTVSAVFVVAYLRTSTAPSPPRGTADNTDTPDLAQEFDLKITSPGGNSEVDEKVKIEGTYEKRPPKESLAVLEMSTATGRYWFRPQPAVLDEQNKKWWFNNVYVGGAQIGKRGEDRVLCLAILGESGRAMMDYYLTVRDRCGGNPVAVETLTSDITTCAQVTVHRAKIESATPDKEDEPTVKPPEREMLGPNPPRDRVDAVAVAKEFGLRFVEPRENSVVKQRVPIRGVYEKKPPAGSLVVYEETPSDGLFWFKEETPEFNEATKEWSTEIYIGGTKGTARTFHVAILGEAGRALKDYFLSVPEQCDENWAGVKTLTPDIVTCTKVTAWYK